MKQYATQYAVCNTVATRYATQYTLSKNPFLCIKTWKSIEKKDEVRKRETCQLLTSKVTPAQQEQGQKTRKIKIKALNKSMKMYVVMLHVLHKQYGGQRHPKINTYERLKERGELVLWKYVPPIRHLYTFLMSGLEQIIPIHVEIRFIIFFCCSSVFREATSVDRYGRNAQSRLQA